MAVVAGCQAPPLGSGASSSREVAPPPTSGGFDYQLGAAYQPATPVSVVVRDSTAPPLDGAYTVCYVNGFQTQPEDSERWLDRPELLLRDSDGDPVVDPDWPGEYVLDPSTPSRREGILEVVGPVITGCAEDGFDAVEIDNLDTYVRFTDTTRGRVDPRGAVDLATSYVELANEHGLAVGQKNTVELGDAGRDEIGFTFAVVEECAAHDECDRFTEVYGDHVLQVEYTDDLPEPFPQVCSSTTRAPLTILRDRGLTAPDDEEYTWEQCPD
ncbi:endo alpha-1,4 polygalactosaminidase [Spiractinospora alimapuensis]|nr:endo alpha-1,4 polygalactosaminidase [Spiractinospora alimapuensis]